MPDDTKTKNPSDEKCSFCGKPRSAVDDMFEGPGGNVRICDQCIALCGIMMTGKSSPSVFRHRNWNMHWNSVRWAVLASTLVMAISTVSIRT